MTISEIPQIAMRRIDINVSFAASPDDILATVIGFIGPGQSGATVSGNQNTAGAQHNNVVNGGFGAGWEPPQENFGQTQ